MTERKRKTDDVEQNRISMNASLDILVSGKGFMRGLDAMMPWKKNVFFFSNFQKRYEQAVVRDSLKGLDPAMENKIQYKWIHQRVRSMESIWVEAGRSLSAKYNLTQRKAKQVIYCVFVAFLQISLGCVH